MLSRSYMYRTAGTWGFMRALLAPGNDSGAAAHTHTHTLQQVRASLWSTNGKFSLQMGKGREI